MNLAVDTGVAARYEWVGLGYIGQAGLSGNREKAYMAYRPAGPGFTEAWPAWPVANTGLLAWKFVKKLGKAEKGAGFGDAMSNGSHDNPPPLY